MSGSISGSTPEKSAAKARSGVKPMPAGYHTVTPYLIVDGAAKLLDFMTKAFGAKETVRIPAPGGKIGHAEVKIGDSVIMLGDAMMEFKPMAMNLYLYVDDVDATFKRALQAGATSVKEPVDQFYGDRSGCVKDASGNTWWIATHVEDVPLDELKRRAQEMQHKMQKQ